MNYQLRDVPLLRKILWADFLLGGGTAVPGLLWHRPLARFLGLPAEKFLVIAAVTLAYAVVAILLARQNLPPVRPLRLLIFANWAWAAVSIVLLAVYAGGATVFGVIFLVLQPLVVGGLAYLEGRHLQKAP